MKTERLVILVTPEQKRTLARRAKALGVSMAELLRRSSEGIYGDSNEQALAVLARDLLKSARESRAALRAALSETQATLKQLRQRRRERRIASKQRFASNRRSPDSPPRR